MDSMLGFEPVMGAPTKACFSDNVFITYAFHKAKNVVFLDVRAALRSVYGSALWHLLSGNVPKTT